MPIVVDQDEASALVRHNFLDANNKQQNRNKLVIDGTHLPREIIVLLATYLNLQDVIALSLVNHATHRAINDPNNNLKVYIPTINTTVSYHRMLNNLKNGFPELDKLDDLTKSKQCADGIANATTTITMNDCRNNTCCDDQTDCSTTIISGFSFMSGLFAYLGTHEILLSAKMTVALGTAAGLGVCAGGASVGGVTACGIFKCANKLAASRSAKLEDEIGIQQHLLHKDQLIKTGVDSGGIKQILQSATVYTGIEKPRLVTMR